MNERTSISIRSKNMGTEVRFEIEDRGIGIPPESRERVFERFYRLKPEQSYVHVRGWPWPGDSKKFGQSNGRLGRQSVSTS